MRPQMHPGESLGIVAVAVALILATSPTSVFGAEKQAQQETDPTGFQPPAWYSQPELGTLWKRFTGRYIFQRTCTSCHQWGPDYWSRTQWQAYFEEFPERHEPPVSRDYADLTAMFRPADYVPDQAQRSNALREFLLWEAPERTGSELERLAPYDGLPKVGDPAPDFEIVDVEGHRHRVSEYRGKKQLVLVFSRAHW